MPSFGPFLIAIIQTVYLHNWFIVSLLNNAKVGPVAKLEPIGEELRAEGAGKKKRKAGFTEFPSYFLLSFLFSPLFHSL